MNATITTCQCGWPVASLQTELKRERAVLAEIRNGKHPFRKAGIQGQLRRIASLEGHLAEEKKEVNLTAEVAHGRY